MNDIFRRLMFLFHWIGFLSLVGLILVYGIIIFTGTFSNNTLGGVVQETIEFLFDAPPDGNPIWWLWWLAITHYPIKWILTGNKSFFPWRS